MLVLRVVVGIVFFMHGYQKLGMGHAGVTGFFGQVGAPLPAVSAALIMLLETTGAIALVHLANGFSVGDNGYEFVLVLAAASLGLAISGPGAASIDDVIARKRSGGA